MRRVMLTTAIGLTVGYGAIVALAFAFQDQLLFQPNSRLLATPSDAGMPYETVRLDTEDGIPASSGVARRRLLGWKRSLSWKAKASATIAP